MEKNFKPFDLEAAKAGAKVVTRCGSPVRIICFDAKGVEPIVGLVGKLFGETPVAYRNDGRFCLGGPSHFDLCMAPVKHSGWVWLRNVCGDVIACGVYGTKEEAESDGLTCGNYIATIPVEWEE